MRGFLQICFVAAAVLVMASQVEAGPFGRRGGCSSGCSSGGGCSISSSQGCNIAPSVTRASREDLRQTTSLPVPPLAKLSKPKPQLALNSESLFKFCAVDPGPVRRVPDIRNVAAK